MAETIVIVDTLRSWIADAYELWWRQGADHVRGGFHERLHQDGSPTDEPRRSRLHPRQMFAFSHAARLGWRGSSAQAVEHALQFFVAHYRRTDGMYRSLVAPSGAALSDDVVLYDQAFALLGLASAYSTVGHQRPRELAADLHDRLRERLAHASIGFHESFARDRPLSSNSHMHLLEASLAWLELDADDRWPRLAQELIDLALRHLIDSRSGAVVEFFDDDWRPTQLGRQGIIDPGHQFEWAWLLLRYYARGGDTRLVSAALRLIEIGETHGVDRSRCAVIAELNTDFGARHTNARLWSQCERLKAACIALETTGESRFSAIALEAAQTLVGYLETPLRGLWRDCLDDSGAFIEEAAPASSFYHIVCAVLEITRVAPLFSPPPGSPTDCRPAGVESAC
jgi:mannose-6-phosphate isomerase